MSVVSSFLRNVLKFSPKIPKEPLSYHDLYITTEHITRTAISDLPFDYMVTCTRTGAWELWKGERRGAEVLVASEYGENGLRLDVDGIIIIDSLSNRYEDDDDG